MNKLERMVAAAALGAVGAVVGIFSYYEFASKPKSRFADFQQELFAEQNIPIESAEKYNRRFPFGEISDLAKNNIPPHIADLYDVRFRGSEIVSFVKQGVSPEVAKGYLHNRFEGWAGYLAKNGILPDAALEYDERFNGSEIIELAKERSFEIQTSSFAESNFTKHPNIPAKVANAYHKTFKVYEIVMLQNEGIGPAEANEYAEANPKVYASDIRKIHLHNIPAKKAVKYAELFGDRGRVEDIFTLIENNVSFEEAQKFIELNKKYGVNIGSRDMAYFKNSNIPFEEVEKEARRHMFDKVFER